MSEAPRSSLPDDRDYWDRLAARVGADAAGPLAAYRARDAWYGVLAHRAGWLVAASIAAIALLWLILPPRPPSPAFTWIERALAPAEAAGTLVAGTRPPSVEVLMTQFTPDRPEASDR